MTSLFLFFLDLEQNIISCWINRIDHLRRNNLWLLYSSPMARNDESIPDTSTPSWQPWERLTKTREGTDGPQWSKGERRLTGLMREETSLKKGFKTIKGLSSFYFLLSPALPLDINQEQIWFQSNKTEKYFNILWRNNIEMSVRIFNPACESELTYQGLCALCQPPWRLYIGMIG